MCRCPIAFSRVAGPHTRNLHARTTQYSSDFIADETVTASLENQTLYETPLNRSYKCIAESPVKLDENVELKIASMRVEPFRTTPFNNNFSKGKPLTFRDHHAFSYYFYYQAIKYHHLDSRVRMQQ